jgi:hypothetical protein
VAAPSNQADFLSVRLPSGVVMYVRNTPAAIDKARRVHGIKLENEWLAQLDPDFAQFREDVSIMIDTLINDKMVERIKTKDTDDDYLSVPFNWDADEDMDYLVAVCYSAFAELKIKAWPGIERQFDNLWVLYVVD